MHHACGNKRSGNSAKLQITAGYGKAWGAIHTNNTTPYALSTRVNRTHYQSEGKEVLYRPGTIFCLCLDNFWKGTQFRQ